MTLLFENRVTEAGRQHIVNLTDYICNRAGSGYKNLWRD